MLLIIVMQIKLNVAVVAEENRVLLRVSCCSIACTTGVIEALMVFLGGKARDMRDEIKKNFCLFLFLSPRVSMTCSVE